MLKGFSLLVLLLGFSSAWSAQAMNLQEYLKTVSERHRSLKAYDAQKEAADFREQSGDIELVPTMSAAASYTDDKNPLSQFAFFGATETKVTEYDLGFQKKFSSGTMVGVSAQAIDYQNIGNLPPGLDQYSNFTVGSLGVSLSQSLWKNFFGHGTRLRWERQDAATRAEKGSYDLQAKNLLVNAEAAFWDYLYSLENLAISRDSLERSKRIESWTRRRVNDGISERADLYQAQALVTSRQLLLIAVEDDLAAARQTLRDYLELGPAENLPEMQGDLSQTRSISSMVDGSGGKVMQLQAYQIGRAHV